MSRRQGDTFLIRYESADGVLRGARPTRFVAERNGYVASWLPAGTTIAMPVMADGRSLRECTLRERFVLPRATRLTAWRPGGILILTPRHGAHSIWVFPEGWYVNLERLHVWHEHGCDTRDHVLDLWCERPREWRWKDEDELAEAVEFGVVSHEVAPEIRAEGGCVAGMIERWEAPLCDGWEGEMPTLPPDWDR